MALQSFFFLYWILNVYNIFIGTHISNTRDAKAFALLSEEGIAKGIRRVTAVTTDYAFEAIKKAADLEEEVNQASKLEGNVLEQVCFIKYKKLKRIATYFRQCFFTHNGNMLTFFTNKKIENY